MTVWTVTIAFPFLAPLLIVFFGIEKVLGFSTTIVEGDAMEKLEVRYFTRAKKREKDTADEKEAVGERDLMTRLPPELKTHILLKLPAKSVSKFISVSKMWSSFVREKDLADQFISRSARRPGLLFTFEGSMEFLFLSCSQDEPSVRYSRTGNPLPHICNLSSPTRGLICGEQEPSNRSKVICNPSTGQFITLPRIKSMVRDPDEVPHFLGYEPANDRYKVLIMTVGDWTSRDEAVVSEEHKVFTVGDKRKSWRRVECKVPHYPITRELCKDGILYYGAVNKLGKYNDDVQYLIVSFDLRTEAFGVINLPDGVGIIPYDQSRLVNYNGKIALATDTMNSVYDLWVLDDIDKQEWYKLPLFRPVVDMGLCFSCIGTVDSGEIVFQTSKYDIPFFLVYHDINRKTFRRVDIEGAPGGPQCLIMAFLDHVESPMYLQKEVLTRR